MRDPVSDLRAVFIAYSLGKTAVANASRVKAPNISGNVGGEIDTPILPLAEELVDSVQKDTPTLLMEVLEESPELDPIVEIIMPTEQVGPQP